MDSELTRQLIRLRLQDGRLPRDRAVELGFGPGSGQACDGCGAAITAHQTMTLRLDAADWSEIRFHDECFQIWEIERLKDPHPGRPGSTSAKKDRAASEGERSMRRRLASLILCGGVAVLGSACATKSFVETQVGATESKLTQQMSATETKLRETADRAGENRRAVDVADQRLNGLDLRVSEAGARASSAETRADLATGAARDVEARLSQRLASRNRYRLLDTKFVYFDSGQTEIRSQDVNELEDVAKALTADPNATLELQGFADSRGSDRYNRELSRERVEAVMRYLVQRHGIELRQLGAIPMGKVALGAGEKASPEALARARRVDIRLLAPWSSWEDAQSQIAPTAPAQTVTVIPAPRGPATISALPVQAKPMQPPQPARIDGPPRGRLLEFLKTIRPKELGGEE